MDDEIKKGRHSVLSDRKDNIIRCARIHKAEKKEKYSSGKVQKEIKLFERKKLK